MKEAKSGRRKTVVKRKAPSRNFDEYLAAVPQRGRGALKQIRTAIPRSRLRQPKQLVMASSRSDTRQSWCGTPRFRITACSLPPPSSTHWKKISKASPHRKEPFISRWTSPPHRANQETGQTARRLARNKKALTEYLCVSARC
jgi:hypothetical protein